MVDYSDRLKEAMKRVSMSTRQLADHLGVSYQAVRKVENGTSKEFSATNHEKAARILKVSASWLATGKGQRSAASVAVGAGSDVEPGPDIRGRVPLISWVQAGTWHEASDLFQPGDAEDWLLCPRSHSASSYALRVRGDSMTAPHGNTRTYPEGCIIFVDPERRSPANGERIVARLNGADSVTFKVYKNEDGRQWLQPLNPQHQPIREPFVVLGTVIGKWVDE